MPEDDIRQIMADETARLYAPPDLVNRVIRSTRRRKTNRIRLATLATAVAVAGVAAPAYLILSPGSASLQGSGAGAPRAVSATSQPDTTDQAAQEPPAIVVPADDDPAPEERDLGDLGDGKAFGHVRVGYLPDGLQWSHWSLDFGDKYTTSWNYDGDENGFYCVQIYVYEGQAVQAADTRLRAYREEGKGAEVTIGDRTGYLVTQWVGEDGGKGTPTLILNMGEKRRAEIMFSPVYAKKFTGAKAIDAELKKIAEGLTAGD
ncbi:hypothetical protein [Microtetraspora malaysiensis]|uniref:DUF4367 domain-containing protein n=1 Tax=Microtetraspora malaysiensis TaxID=161358 RepID=A0ABW6T4L7_9ACTN